MRVNRRPTLTLFLISIAMAFGSDAVSLLRAQTKDGLSPLAQLRTIGAGDRDSKMASQLVAAIQSNESFGLIDVLKAMKGATPIGKNWIAGVANQKYRSKGASLKDDLTTFLNDPTQDGEARYKVFDWLTDKSPELRNRLLAGMIEDPSLELRYLAIETAIPTAKDKTTLLKLLDASRHPNQTTELVSLLEKEGVKIDQARQFGFLSRWKLVGPMDHVGTKNFNKVFPIESDWIQGKVADSYEGKNGTVSWIEHLTNDKNGNVNLAEIYNKEKGCIVYGMTEFNSPIEGEAQIRLGCINAQKVWLNGQLVMSNEVYHTGSQIDQYIESVQLKKGINRLLIKVCQNEQKDSWAQDYQFMLRITDMTGKAIQSIEK